MHDVVWQLVLQHAMNEAGKLCMQAPIAGDQYIGGESQALH